MCGVQRNGETALSTIAQRRRLTSRGMKLSTEKTDLGFRAEVTNERGDVVGIAIRDTQKEAETDAIHEALEDAT